MHRIPAATRAVRRPARLRQPVRSAGRPSRLPMHERRQQLIDAAARVFAERGFRGATTREIAEQAGVTEAVIFQHFPDKDSLYAAILEAKCRPDETERWLARLEAAAAEGNDHAVVRELFKGILEHHDRDPHVLRLMIYSALEQHPLAPRLQAHAVRLYRFLEGFVREGQRAGRFRAGPPAVLVRAILAVPSYYVMQRRLFGPPWPAASPDDLIESGVQFVLAGLACTKKEAS